ncbi:putative GATA zinc finger domain-containing protein 25 [Eriocheir sinensis]|uniref:putative GATA zinc finger domain-containing protein 25 n=1 Tax=Eriocheir sinensis TaxID=95602 RepID=UPI0021CA71CF|nr:putative GATA zinc finger domain-containing protein 25 [Eriocheir sinensis]
MGLEGTGGRPTRSPERPLDSINILGAEVDSKLSFDRHLENVARKVSLRVTLLRRVRHLLDTDGLLRLYKAQVRPIMEYSPLTGMGSAQCHLSLLYRVQRRAERLIYGASDQEQQQQQQGRQMGHRQWQQQQQQQHHRHHPRQDVPATR